MVRLFVAALVGLAILFGTALIASRVEEPFFVVISGLLAAFVGGPWATLHFWRPDSAVELARRSGDLVVRVFNIASAWQIAEREDEGLHFVLGLASGGTLFLSGQFLYEPVQMRDFPCQSLTVSLNQKSGDVLALECKGPRVEAAPPLVAFSEEELEAGVYPGSYRLYPEPPTQVLSMFRRAA
jgi:hypothetical protein